MPVPERRFRPANGTRRFDQTDGKPRRDDWNTSDVLAANAGLHEKPLARKTMSDGYVANIRTMMRHGVGDYSHRDPFAGRGIKVPGWP